MKIVMVHNFYQIAGGEDTVFFNEVRLLKMHGHDVEVYVRKNSHVVSLFDKIAAFFSCLFSVRTFLDFSNFLKKTKPDIVHVHNYFPLLSPAIFFSCAKNNVPVVHTLHNFRAICPSAILSHYGVVNTTSVKGSPFWTVREKVYRESILGTFAVYLMVVLHRKIGTWQTKVDQYICLTEFAKSIYIEAGWPVEKLCVKPNFVFPNEDNFSVSSGLPCKKHGAIYVGRLAEEKGVRILLDAWQHIDYPLTIVGDGPLSELVRACNLGKVNFVGWQSPENVLSLLESAAFIIMPSTWFEGMPMVLVEALSVGTPALVSNIGGMKEAVLDGVTGKHFESGNTSDLIMKVKYLINDSPVLEQFSLNARKYFNEKFTAEAAYPQLMSIYSKAIQSAGGDYA